MFSPEILKGAALEVLTVAIDHDRITVFVGDWLKITRFWVFALVLSLAEPIDSPLFPELGQADPGG